MRIFLIFIILFALLLSFTFAEDVNVLSRKKKFKFPFKKWWYGFGLHALAIVYWLKVKAVIIAFIVGTALVWGAKYFWPNSKCPKQIETVHEGSIIPFDHGPIWSGPHHHHDHVPYSSDISFSGHDPYSAYSSYSDSSPPTAPDAENYLDHNPHDRKWKRKSRSVRQRQQLDNENTEDQISDLMFLFLGVGSTECRKRFLCEWEFHSQRHPITRMAFRIIGRGVFRKYARDPKDGNSAKSFQDCARVHDQCTVIEEDTYTQHNNNESENSNNASVEESNNVQQTTTKDPIAKAIFSRPLKYRKY